MLWQRRKIVSDSEREKMVKYLMGIVVEEDEIEQLSMIHPQI